MKKKPSAKNKKNTLSITFKLYYIVMIACYLYLGSACIYKYIKYDSLDKCILELVLILTLSLIIEYVHIIGDNGREIRKKLSKKKNKSEKIFFQLRKISFFYIINTKKERGKTNEKKCHKDMRCGYPNDSKCALFKRYRTSQRNGRNPFGTNRNNTRRRKIHLVTLYGIASRNG